MLHVPSISSTWTWFFQLFLLKEHLCGLVAKSSRLQIQCSGFDFRRYQIFWEVVVLKRGPLSLVDTIEELLERKSSGSSLESREYGRRDLSSWPRGTLYPQMLPLTWRIIGGRSVGIVHSQTQAIEFSFTLKRCLISERITVHNRLTGTSSPVNGRVFSVKLKEFYDN
jgi:hypothetical protein